ncbi:MAG TPA: hypothetical protein VJA19_01065 [Pseudomonas sp.]|nr:hypothetical protein [Pseudomonas sp.]
MDLRVHVLDCHPLNLMNNQALVKITITGEVVYPKGHDHWRPTIKQVHANERFSPNALTGNRVSNIEFTPIVHVVKDASYTGAPLPFEISFEHVVNTFNWGPNTIVFLAGGREQRVVLHQRK